MIDFANILFAGSCNRYCPFCIGKEVPKYVNQENLNLFPLRNQDAFIHQVRDLQIPEVVFTGTTTDPQLYRYEGELLSKLREHLPGVRFSVHTNGVLALRKMEIFNSYDRACLSFPSFIPTTYQKMMGSRNVPDLEAIISESKIPIKVSCILTEENESEIESFLERLSRIGIKRAVIRTLYGNKRNFEILKNWTTSHFYRENPVYNLHGMEVTVWDFERATSTSINLFPNGTIGSTYLLTQTPEFKN